MFRLGHKLNSSFTTFFEFALKMVDISEKQDFSLKRSRPLCRTSFLWSILPVSPLHLAPFRKCFRFLDRKAIWSNLAFGHTVSQVPRTYKQDKYPVTWEGTPCATWNCWKIIHSFRGDSSFTSQFDHEQSTDQRWICPVSPQSSFGHWGDRRWPHKPCSFGIKTYLII